MLGLRKESFLYLFMARATDRQMTSFVGGKKHVRHFAKRLNRNITLVIGDRGGAWNHKGVESVRVRITEPIILGTNTQKHVLILQ